MILQISSKNDSLRTILIEYFIAIHRISSRELNPFHSSFKQITPAVNHVELVCALLDQGIGRETIRTRVVYCRQYSVNTELAYLYLTLKYSFYSE